MVCAAQAARADDVFSRLTLSFTPQYVNVAHLDADAPAQLLGVGAHRAQLDRERLLIVGGDAGVEPRPSCFWPGQKPSVIVPEYDGGRDQIEAAGTIALVFAGTIGILT